MRSATHYSNLPGIAHDAATGTVALPAEMLPAVLLRQNSVSPTFNSSQQRVSLFSSVFRRSGG